MTREEMMDGAIRSWGHEDSRTIKFIGLCETSELTNEELEIIKKEMAKPFQFVSFQM